MLHHSWFHGKISGPEAVGKLLPAEDGLFLVRESIRHPGDYVLCVSVSGDVIHYRVIYKDDKLTIDNAQYFYNLIDMIEARQIELVGTYLYVMNAFTVGVNLKIPLIFQLYRQAQLHVH